MKKYGVIFLLISILSICKAQTPADTTEVKVIGVRGNDKVKGGYKKQTIPGFLTLGVRSTISTFNDGSTDYAGYGVGGHFRLPFSTRINSEWYADFITNNIGNLAYRKDYHIGWSVMFYLLDPYKGKEKDIIFMSYLLPRFQPFVEAGHCFDYGGLRLNQPNSPTFERWSSAVQFGAGTHYNLDSRFDITLKVQYMMHLGNHIHAHIRDGVVEIDDHQSGALEGHLLTTFSVNYKLFKLWPIKTVSIY